MFYLTCTIRKLAMNNDMPCPECGGASKLYDPALFSVCECEDEVIVETKGERAWQP